MPRTRNGAARKLRHKRLLARAKGFVGGRSKLFRTANETLKKAGVYRFEGRKIKKRDYRSLWIIRISAATAQRGMRYSQFINGLLKAKITLNRKSLSEIAIADPVAFDQIFAKAKEALGVK